MGVSLNPCPFLGCAEDRSSVCSYPSKANVCFAAARRGKRYDGIHRHDQANFCLASYPACSVYQKTLVILGSGTPAIQEPPHRRRSRLGPLARLWPFRRGRGKGARAED